MQVVVWIIIIMLIVFLIWLLRRWIRRLIFILILLVLAFFIYGIFNPSGAARIWYNVRTFPQRMASWMGSGEKFLDYDSYKLDISSIGDKIGDEIGEKIDSLKSNDEVEDLDSDEEEIDIDLDYDSDEKEDRDIKNIEEEIVEEDSSIKGQTIKSFPKSIKFVQFPELEKENISEVAGQLTGYSKSDLLGVINKYIEKNLDDYTDILVTVEYEDDGNNPQRIILETQSKSEGNGHSVYFLGSVDELLEKSEGEKVDVSSNNAISSNNQRQNNVQPKQTTSNRLTQKDQQEAEEIFSILF